MKRQLRSDEVVVINSDRKKQKRKKFNLKFNQSNLQFFDVLAMSAKSSEFECASTNFHKHLPPSNSGSDIDDKTNSFLDENIENTSINK